jgi:hypothetical protein
MNITSNIKKKIILILVVFFSLNILILAEEQTYDPSKEPPFDKEQAVKELKDLVSNKLPSYVNYIITEKYIMTKRYKAAIYVLEELKKMPNFDQERFMNYDLCLCYYLSGIKEKEEVVNCLKNSYFIINYPNWDLKTLLPEKRDKLIREFDINILYILSTITSSSFNDDRLRLFVEELIDKYLTKHTDITVKEKTWMINQKQLYIEAREEKILTEKRKELRKKQILDYIKELEKLLVARDEQRLSEFLNKHIVPDMQKFFLERYIKLYFSKNYSEVHFKLIADSIGESIHLTGMDEELTNVEYMIITVPESSGEACPEISFSEIKGNLYCKGLFWFKFNSDKMLVE